MMDNGVRQSVIFRWDNMLIRQCRLRGQDFKFAPKKLAFDQEKELNTV
ncbi:hypothetical protein [Rhizobium sp. YS-1r]|nr:hypothetical protein [Rhizobium sp. YS-1r]